MFNKKTNSTHKPDCRKRNQDKARIVTFQNSPSSACASIESNQFLEAVSAPDLAGQLPGSLES